MPSGAPSSSRRSRPTLRQATFVLPKTGQRLKGLVNLRNSTPTSNDNEERRGLLTNEIQHYEGYLDALTRRIHDKWTQTNQFVRSEQGIGVLKYSLAYLVGSLATFIPAVSAMLGHQDGKHMVATVTVYFHPARSQGAMFKALICAFLAFCYSTFLTITSMFVEMFFQDTLELTALGHAVVLIVFCGGGLGFVGWTKQRLGDPLVNVACSLTALSTITLLTKEGSVQSGDISLAKIFQVLKMVLMGVVAVMVVSFFVFPISARKKLRSNLVTVTDTLALMMALITESFLSGTEEVLVSTEFVDAEAKHRKAYSQLDRLVREAKLEHYVAGTEKEYRLEKNLVRWVQDITHNMGGLRNAASLQFSLIRETIARESTSPEDLQGSSTHVDYFTPLERSWSFPDGSFLEPIVERPEEELSPGGSHQLGSAESTPRPALLPADVFTIFISHLGPAMRSLAFTLKEIFKEIPFGPAPHYKVSVNGRLRISLDRALDLYKESREKTLAALYQQKETMKLKTREAEADLEEVTASCGHFSFSLLEFGEQLREMLSILDELQLEVEERPHGRTWSWLKVWQWSRNTDTAKIASFHAESASRSFNPPANEQALHGHARHASDGLIAHDRLSVNVQTRKGPSENDTTKQRLGYRLWKCLGFFRRDDTKYAIKVGAGAAIYALPAFLPSTRPFYGRWRGEWGLLSYMLVCSMTIGASNTTGYARFLGTCLGAVAAIFAWNITAGNVFALAFLGWIMAVWTGYITIVRGNGPMGRFIMLTYNLSVLYGYSLSQKAANFDEDEGGSNPIMTEIALHRVVAVLSGCIWGIIITRMIWPISARSRLKESLSLLWLHLSLVWKRDPLSIMAKGQRSVLYMTPRQKLEIERFLSRLESLQAAAGSEFELKSAFPEASYANIVRRTRSMVNSFHTMNIELMKNDLATEGEISLLQYTKLERRQLSARVSHLLSVIASSMKLEYPLNDVLPSIEHARDRLLARIYRYRLDHEASQQTTDEDCALLYAYILVTGQLSNEITEIIAEIGQLFGGNTAKFGAHRCIRFWRLAGNPTMQIDPAALSRSDSISNPKGAVPNGSVSAKTSRALISVPRLELEHAYTDLKAAIGDKWAEYKESTALFLLGHYNQSEYSSRVDYFLCADPKNEHLHNNFVCALIGNLTRDLPDHGVANWVSANDKPSTVSKPVSGDAAEQRLKTEVMKLPPRDRRRIKGIPERDPNETAPIELEESHLAKQFKLPSQVPASAGGLNKTNWELEIRKRYAQPLAAETGEFPDAESIHARMVPICYEESLPSGAGLPCAEFMAIATETFVKEVLSAVFSRTRSNGPSGTINNMMMRQYRHQLEVEELAFTRGEIAKDAATGLLPVEAREANIRKPLGVRDLRLTLELGGGVLGHMPLIVDQIMNGYFEDELETERHERLENGVGEPHQEIKPEDEMDLDEDEDEDGSLLDWEGGTLGDRDQLSSLLDECLSMAA
ncbi:Transcriptional coactivator SAGA-type complex, Ada1/Tada1 [Penicillium expansum]|uniref:Transcriptional coactivator SAGA-type complex, Ada1/Tada1 n=1 Tax=Penicillium expansum TaxID=27334 RepID=A0A0A2IM46_PENEN|nr:Transcriptional coactivator SAGA-type complex, Ada1/Tada1 [Penicillium expansum]KGO43528.1 Transcriptional coactivator SAGA-type complex, Ada1/Tada1 [Penicillium expansum]KGO52624.1 Transcriptional coactivator SAGA-type complex, Ada1/Tada1 [Penicillium expansum]KGO64337.1 Transcriptional coactivator SAGA-type complex, Ada1/Tada1 [Penicillium expansum]